MVLTQAANSNSSKATSFAFNFRRSLLTEFIPPKSFSFLTDSFKITQFRRWNKNIFLAMCKLWYFFPFRWVLGRFCCAFFSRFYMVNYLESQVCVDGCDTMHKNRRFWPFLWVAQSSRRMKLPAFLFLCSSTWPPEECTTKTVPKRSKWKIQNTKYRIYTK